MASQRLEIRIDTERQSKLRKVAEAKGTTISELVRDLIDQAFEESQRIERLHRAVPPDHAVEDSERAARMRAVERIAAANIEVVPDPETLSRQLASTHDLCHLP